MAIITIIIMELLVIIMVEVLVEAQVVAVLLCTHYNYYSSYICIPRLEMYLYDNMSDSVDQSEKN